MTLDFEGGPSSSTFCVLPWIHRFIVSSGDFFICRKMDLQKVKGKLRDNQGISFNLNTHQLGMEKNAEALKKLRLSLLKGDYSSYCQACWQDEGQGKTSDRLRFNEMLCHDFDFKRALDVTDLETGALEVDVDICYFDIILGNECAGKCLTCHPMHSRGLYETWNRVHQLDSFQCYDRVLELKPDDSGKYKMAEDCFSWCKKESFWKDLLEVTPSVTMFRFSGGEPLMNEDLYHFLQTLVTKDLAYNIKVTIETGGMFSVEDWTAILRRFSRYEIQFSIDGIGLKNDYIRYGSSWDQVLRNLLAMIKEMGNENHALSIAHTVSMFNIFYLPEFFQWAYALPLSLKFRSDFFQERLVLNFIRKPILSIQNLSEQSKEVIKSRCLNFYDHIDEYLNGYSSLEKKVVEESLFQHLSATLLYLFEHSAILDVENLFKMSLSHIDNYTNKNFSSIFPEYHNVLINIGRSI